MCVGGGEVPDSSEEVVQDCAERWTPLFDDGVGDARRSRGFTDGASNFLCIFGLSLVIPSSSSLLSVSGIIEIYKSIPS